ncbi:MAG: adenine phosphoribosyltransferase [Actinomycetota bacterium]
MTHHTGDAGSDVAALIASHLRDVPDFPRPGIVFKDITGLLADGAAFAKAITCLATAAKGADIVVGIEARGFVVAAALAHELGCGLVLVRKAGKLPPPTLRRRYELEYGTAEIEVPIGPLDGSRVYLVDDILATGGTILAATDLITAAGGDVVGVGLLLELGFLHGRGRLTTARLTAPLTALLSV